MLGQPFSTWLSYIVEDDVNEWGHYVRKIDLPFQPAPGIRMFISMPDGADFIDLEIEFLLWHEDTNSLEVGVNLTDIDIVDTIYFNKLIAQHWTDIEKAGPYNHD